MKHEDIDHTGLTGVGGGAHAASHESGGSDEIDVTGLTGAGGGGGGTAVGVATHTAGDETTTSTTFVDVDATNAKVIITTGAKRCLVTVMATGKISGAGTLSLDIDLDGARLGQTFGLIGSEHTTATDLSFSFVTGVLSAGSHTFKLQWKVTANTGTLYASSGVLPLQLAVIELAS